MWRFGRSGGAIWTVAVTLTAVIACSGSGAHPPAAGVRPDGFPTGVFAKTFTDPDLGPMRLSWVFDPGGDWAEVPEATAGQSFPTGPARGHYRVEGDLVRLDVDFPSFWGWTQHRWRLDGDKLITEYDDSEIASDASYFDMLDRQPWVRVP